MATTYTLIASTVLASNTATITFSSIPSTYTDLVVRLSARNVGSGNMYIKLNNDTTTKYSQTRLFAEGTSVASSRETNASYFYFYPGSTRSDFAANLFSNGEIYFPNYNSTSTKVASSFGAIEVNNTTQNVIEVDAHQYRGTSGISSITFTLSDSPAETMAVGSSFYLYGIKNS